MTEYKPFILRVGRRTGDVYPVTADALDWYGHGSILAELPLLSPADLQQATTWHERAFTDHVIERDYVRALGGRMFHTLFPEPIARGFWAASERVKPEGGLRVLLDLPADLAGLPWELMYDDAGNHGFLARSVTAPVARHFAGLPLPRRPPLEGLADPLRVLVIIASPPNTLPLNDEAEVAGIVRGMAARRRSLGGALDLAGRQLLRTRSAHGLFQRLSNRNLIEIDVLRDATYPKVQQTFVNAKAAGKPYHIVHFIGHGAADEGAAVLLLESEDKERPIDAVAGERFAELVAEPSVCLVTLNACQTADALDVFNSVAEAILRRGVPAVIGMQTPILDRAAVDFACEFYGQWAAGGSIERALSYARRTMSAESPAATAQWATPVLYLGSVDGLDLPAPPRRPRRVRWSLAVAMGVALGAIGVGAYFSTLPKVMDRAFNVAVVEFGQQDDTTQPVHASRWARRLSHDLYVKTEPLERQPGLEDVVDVQYIRGPLRGITPEHRAVEAQGLAHRINATVLVYGTVDLTGPPNTFTPELYVTEQLPDADELTGANRFGRPIPLRLPLNDPLNRFEFTDQFNTRVRALDSFMLGVAYLRIDRPQQALIHLEAADKAPGWEAESGKEVLYLFQGAAWARQPGADAARRAEDAYNKALAVTHQQYARAYLALGNLDLEARTAGGGLDSQRLDAAIAAYQQALIAPLQPASAYVDVKARYNLGLAYNLRALAFEDVCPDPDAETSLKSVISDYEQNPSVPLIRELGARAHYQLGLQYEACGDRRVVEGATADAVALYSDAAELYQRSAAIAAPESVQAKTWFGLPIGAPRAHEQAWQWIRWPALHKLAYTELMRAELGQPALYDAAIANDRQVIQAYEKSSGIVPDEIAAEANYNLGLACQARMRIEEAITAFRQVLRIEPEGSELSLKAQEKLQQLGTHAE